MHFGLDLYFNAWRDLSTTRVESGAPISWALIQSYAEKFDFDSDQKETLHYHIAAMDEVYLQYVKEKFASGDS